MSSKKKRRNEPAESNANQGIPRKSITASKKAITPWLIGLLIILPVLYSESLMDAYLNSRYLFLSVFVLLVLAVFYFARTDLRQVKLTKPGRLVFLFSILFVAWSVICMFSALNYREGFVPVFRYVLFLIALVIVAITTGTEERAALNIGKTLVIVAIFQSVVGIFQFYEIAFTQVPGANSKPYGLMSNRNLFGSAQTFLLPFILYVIYQGNKNWKYIAGFASILLGFSILLSQTRSAWLATLAIIFISLILVLIFSPSNRKKWLIGTAGGFAIITLLVLLVLSSDKEGTLSQSIKERAKSLAGVKTKVNESISNAQERVKIWNKTIQLIKDKPLTGAGPGNWRITIPNYGTEGLVWAYGEYAPDQPHNEYLHVAAETGLPGAVLYYAVWILLAFVGLRSVIHSADEDQRILAILMLGGLAAFATDAMFSFPSQRIEHHVYFTFMAGTILGLSSKTQEATTIVFKKWIGVSALLVILFNIFLAYSSFNFEVHMAKAKDFEANKQYQNVLEEVESGKSNFITLGPDVGTPLQIRSANAYKELKQYENALQECNKALAYQPNSMQAYNNRGTIYTKMGQFEKAIEAYNKALKIAPHYSIILKNLALNYFNVKNYKACLNAINQLPKDADSTYFRDLLRDANQGLQEQTVAPVTK